MKSNAPHVTAFQVRIKKKKKLPEEENLLFNFEKYATLLAEMSCLVKWCSEMRGGKVLTVFFLFFFLHFYM